jgi:hypothetical protein
MAKINITTEGEGYSQAQGQLNRYSQSSGTTSGATSYPYLPPAPHVGRVVYGNPEQCPPPRRELHSAPEKTAPDLISKIIGWRSWHISPDGALMSCNQHAIWFPGPNHANCHMIGSAPNLVGHAPDEHCSCGFYGLYTADQAEQWRVDMFTIAFGIFLAWGDVILHPMGFRAEIAEPFCLVADAPSQLLSAVGERYRIPVLRSRKQALKTALKADALEVPAELAPEKKEAQQPGQNNFYSSQSVQPIQRIPSLKFRHWRES